jgi:replicative DNA helicase
MAGIPFDDRTAPDTAATGAAGPPPLQSAQDMLGGLLEEIAARHKTQEGGGWTGGLRCGFHLIDTDLRGLRRRSLTTLSAEPSIGKSTLANQISYQVANWQSQNAAALYVSFEDDPQYLLLKHLSRLSGWRINALEGGQVAPDDPQLLRAARSLREVPLFYLRGGARLWPSVIIERAEEAKTKAKAADLLLVIDYLQLFSRFAAGKSQLEQIGLVLSELLRIRDETDAALLVISSQNRETNKGGDAGMFGSRGSGEIEYDSDTLLVLNKVQGSGAGSPSWQRKLTAVKTRYGGVGATAELVLDGTLGTFQECNQ